MEPEKRGASVGDDCSFDLDQMPDVQMTGVTGDHLPVFSERLKQRLTYSMAWTPEVSDLEDWKARARAKIWELTWQTPDRTGFDPEIVDEIDRGDFIARKIAFNLTRDSRVIGLLLLPQGKGPFPATVFYHDHGSKFDIGKEKLISPWDDPDKLHSAQGWADRHFSGRFPGDELARRGYVVLAVDALGWGDRGPLTYDGQQALAANFANMGSSLAGLMALEDTRAAEFLASMPEVNKQQIASAGFSMGAFRAWQAAALTDTITATVAVNWMATAKSLMVPGNNQLRGGSAWHMAHPGLMQFLDYPDVASLVAPRPMLVFAGKEDRLFPVSSVTEALQKMGRVWAAWQRAYCLDSKIWPDAHVFEAEQQDYAFDWLDRQFSQS